MSFKDLFIQKEEGTSTPMSKEEIEALLNSSRKSRNLTANYVSESTEVTGTIDPSQLVDIETIYNNAGLADLSKSVFKVDEFAAIPGIASLPTDVKRQSVIGILSTSGLSVDGLLEDASDRINVLADLSESFANDTNNSVHCWEKEIEELQSQIDERKQKINDRKLLQEKETALITEEINKIDTIVNFINPTTNKQ